MPLTIGLVGAGAGVAGGVAGNLMSAGDRAKALAIQQAALQNIQGINTPDIAQMRLALQQEQLAGKVNPALESAVTLGPSAMQGVSTDPRLAAAQMQALSTMQQIGAGGLRPQDQAALAQIRSQSQTQGRAADQAIMQNMQARGQGGQGAELAQRLASAQAGANSAAQQGLSVGAQANQAALQALMNSGQLGSQMQNQQFGEASAKAQAQDLISRYNAMNQQQVGNTNVGYQNQAQMSNLANQQAVMNANTGLANQQQMYNSNLYQQQYANQLAKAQAAAGASNQAAGALQNNAAATQQMWSGIGQAANQGMGTAATAGALNNIGNKQQAAPSNSDGTMTQDEFNSAAASEQGY